MAVEDFKERAQWHLKSLRKGCGLHGISLKLLRGALAKGGLILQDIGTSEEELEALRAKNKK